MKAHCREGIEIVRRHWIRRHSAVVRITHWLIAAFMAVMLMSGLQIFNAHPALYWGLRSDFDKPVLDIKAVGSGSDSPRGVTIVLGRSIDTTGLLGLSSAAGGEPQERAFPSWMTLPADQNLALGRRWHFLFAWLLVLTGLLYLLHGLLSGHFRRDLVPSGRDIRHIPHSVWDHVRFRFPAGEEARRYNVIQKFAYLIVIFVLLPVLILAGLAMSPGLDTAFPQLLALFGGRQSARTVHFLAAIALVVFVIIHLFEVLISGVYNNLRSMITGRYDIERTVNEETTAA